MDDDYLRADLSSMKSVEEDTRLQVRCLVDSRVVGGLIGKGGEIVKKLREDSGAWIDIGDSVRGASNRVIAAKGALENVVTALHMVAQRVAEIESREEEHPSSTMKITLIIPDGQVGCLIGKGGANIKGFRDKSGASVKMSDMPLDGSSEKSFSVRGSKEQVLEVLALACQQLYENRDRAKSRIPYVPGSSVGYMAGGGYGNGYGGFGGPAPPANYSPYGLGYPSSSSDEPPATILVPVPEHLIGTVIGKGGANIRDVRNRSRANVKVADRDPNGADRIISVTGTRQARDIAVHLILEKQSMYDPSRRGGRAARDQPDISTDEY